MLKRFYRYVDKLFGLSSEFELVTDSRKTARISTSRVLRAVFVTMTTRMGSLNAIEQEQKIGKASLGMSADTMGRVLCKINPDQSRKILTKINHQLKRNKCFTSSPQSPLIFVAVDGHELFSSRSRCCEKCLERVLQINDSDVTEYYHRIVACHLVGFSLAAPLDVEPILPGEGELTAAHRLMKRVFLNYPRFFDGVIGDALYMNTPFFNLCEANGKYVIAVLKEEQRHLYRDADGLFAREHPKRFEENGIQARVWDEEGFNSCEGMTVPIRVLHTEETSARKRRAGNHWLIESQTTTWRWATTVPLSVLSSQQLWRVGHSRWDIENDLFNSLSQNWHLDHCFKHDPVAIINFILILFISFALIQCFHQKNLKASLKKISLIAVSRAFFRDLAELNFRPKGPP